MNNSTAPYTDHSPVHLQRGLHDRLAPVYRLRTRRGHVRVGRCDSADQALALVAELAEKYGPASATDMALEFSFGPEEGMVIAKGYELLAMARAARAALDDAAGAAGMD